MNRRRFLVAATTVTGTVGAMTLAAPFLLYWKPSARAVAIAAPVQVNIEALEPGQQITLQWRGRPSWVLRRTAPMLDVLAELTDSGQLRDPHASVTSQQPPYVTGSLRSLREDYLVVSAICTHLGCVPSFLPEPSSVAGDWPGGYFCPCHASRFDFAGRVFRRVPAPTNLVVPPHRFLSDAQIEVGTDPEVS